ncbi:hypothetical protein VTO73DRAFT_13043 [Trametes versicolor]
MSWAAAQNVDVVLNFVGRGMTPALCVLSAGLTLQARSSPAVAYIMGDQEEALKRVIGRWRVILKRLTDTQRSILERDDPGVISRLEIRLDQLEGRVLMLGAHTETAPWLQRIHPWSSLASRWGQLAYEVGKADTDLKKTTSSVGVDVVRVIREAEAAANELNNAASQTPIAEQSEGTPGGERTEGAPLPITTPLVLARNLPPLPRDMMRTFNEALLTTTALMRPFITPSRGNVLPITTSFDMV